MNQSQTGKKETETIQPHDNDNIEPSSCQEKTLVNNTIREKLNKFTVYEHCVVYQPMEVKFDYFKHPASKRGPISEFSKRSRFRLFQLLAKIDGNLEEKPLFVSLTYHYGHLKKKTRPKKQLHNFLVQVRNFDPDVQFIWRMEFQIRGAPHFHLIIFPGGGKINLTDRRYATEISRIWHKIADPNSNKHKEYGCSVITINSYSQACSYLSKYVAKCHDTEVDLKEGKHWGNSSNLPVKIHHVYSAFDEDSRHLILKIRGWLMANGKEKYADPNYVNFLSEFTVFIDKNEFNELVPDDCVYICDSS